MNYDFEAVSQVNTTIQILVLILCIALLAIRQHRKRINTQIVMVMCAIGCYLASDLYWTVFISMYSHNELAGISPVELGEIGMCLFLMAALRIEKVSDNKLSALKYAAIIFFCLVNGVCWTYWRGSVLNTLLSMIGLLPLCIVNASTIEGCTLYGKTGQRLFFGELILVAVVQFGTISTHGILFEFLDVLAYALWLAGWAALIVLWIRAIRDYSRHENIGPEPLAITVNMVCFDFFALYASEGIMYCFNDAMTTVAFTLMTVSLMRREYRYDLL